MFDDCITRLEKVNELVEATENEELDILTTFLYDRIKKPDSYVVLMGETSSGKSTIINSLLHEHVLKVKASPTTAAITEIQLVDSKEEEGFFAVNNNATMEILTKDQFDYLSTNPDNNLKRLLVRKCLNNTSMKNMRIFDTPGYGSIQSEHEEVLKDFLPSSDVVIYTINYSVGYQSYDYEFLKIVKDLIREDAEVILTINRCPPNCTENDSRISEIRSLVNGLFPTDLKLFLIKNEKPTEEEMYAMPDASQIWNYISDELQKPERLERLKEIYNSYVDDLYLKCDSYIQTQFTDSKITKEEHENMLKIQKESAAEIREAIPKFIDPYFTKIENILPSKFDQCESDINTQILEKIDTQKVGLMEEMQAYTNEHLLPFTVKKESDKIVNYIDVELTDLNEKLEDYLSKKIEEFSTKIDLNLNQNVEVACRNAGKNICQKLIGNGLGKYFLKFGGNGGANAGIANAASHALKKFGDIFGKKFSRETHNALKHTLKKLTLTSMKTVTVIISVVMDTLMLGLEYGTWKAKLRKEIVKGTSKWKVETTKSAIEDLKKLREENISIIDEIASSVENSFEEEQNLDYDKFLELAQKSDKLRTELGVN